MLKRFAITCLWTGLACAGCADKEADEDVLDRLPAIALPAHVVEGLSACGDAVPEAGDVVTRLDDRNGTIVVVRDGQPICAEELADWLDVDGEGISGPETDAPAEVDPCPTENPPDGDEKDPDPIAGPRPIPWMDDKGDDDGDHDE